VTRIGLIRTVAVGDNSTHYARMIERPPAPSSQILRAAFLAATLPLLVACDETPAAQVRAMEEWGFAQRDCFPSPWLESHHPELARRADLRTRAANDACNKTRLIVEEGNDPGGGFYRRYRCRVDGRAVEVSLSASPLDPDDLGSCNYAFSDGPSFPDDELYTMLPWKDPR
jgi:hypothetical protein